MTRTGSGLRPFSVKAKLGTLVVVSVFITTGLLMVALRTRTELRFITVFSVIATLLITQFVAHGLTAPLDEMTTVARSISHGDYTRRVSGAGGVTSSATWPRRSTSWRTIWRPWTGTARSWWPMCPMSCGHPSRR